MNGKVVVRINDWSFLPPEKIVLIVHLKCQSEKQMMIFEGHIVLLSYS